MNPVAIKQSDFLKKGVPFLSQKSAIETLKLMYIARFMDIKMREVSTL